MVVYPLLSVSAVPKRHGPKTILVKAGVLKQPERSDVIRLLLARERGFRRRGESERTQTVPALEISISGG
jgi:hypothetical protein